MALHPAGGSNLGPRQIQRTSSLHLLDRFQCAARCDDAQGTPLFRPWMLRAPGDIRKNAKNFATKEESTTKGRRIVETITGHHH
jgi:hypothetical protein